MDLKGKFISTNSALNILNNQNKVWITWISSNKSLNEGIIGLVDNLEGYCSLYDTTGKFLGNLELNETNEFNQPLTFVDSDVSLMRS